jgi:predicted Zn-dependent peptidase
MLNVGTRHEAAAENGVSHFLEHMAFKGTTRRDAAAIARDMENVGGHLNAYTSRENTAYYAKVLKEDVGLAADIIGDILTHSSFVPEELERERGVILQEIGQANDTPDDIVFDHFQSTAYAEQAMGRPGAGVGGDRLRHDAGRADGLHAPALRAEPHGGGRCRRAGA